MTDLAAKAAELRASHVPGDPLVLVNVWDVASARTVAGAPRCRAIATASRAIAAAHGYADGQRIPFELMLAAVERIAAAVEQPVTADLESGYGETRAHVAETVARAIAAGAVGANLEDRLRPVAEHAAVVKAVRERAEREGAVRDQRPQRRVPARRAPPRRRDRERARLSRRWPTASSCRASTSWTRSRALRARARRPGERARRTRRAAAARARRGGRGESQLRARRAWRGQRRVAAAAERLLARGDYPGELGHRPPAG